jgi:hypothetical protein
MVSSMNKLQLFKTVGILIAFMIIMFVTTSTNVFVYGQNETQVISDLDWSSDSDYLAFGLGNGNFFPSRTCINDDFTINLQDVNTGEITSITSPSASADCSASYVSLAPSDNRLVISRGPLLEVWDLSFQERVNSVFSFREFGTVRWNSNANEILVLSPLVVEVRDETLLENSSILVAESSDAEFTDSTWSPDGQFIASSTETGSITVWKPSDETIQTTFTTHTTAVRLVAWNPLYDVIASGDADGNIYLWNPENGQVISQLQGHIGTIHDLAWRPDGMQLVSTGADDTLRAWDYPSGAMQIIQSNEPVWAVAFSPNGSELAYGGEFQNTADIGVEIVQAPPMVTVTPTVDATASETATPTSTPFPTLSPTPTATTTPTDTATLTPTPPATSTLRIEAESYSSAASGVTFGGTGDEGGGEAIYDFDSGRWIAFTNIDLLGGVVTFRLRADSPGSGNLSLRIGSATAAPFCTLAWTDSGGDYATRETSCSVPVSGVQTLYLTNDSVPFINVNWLEIDRSTGGGAPTYTPSPTLSPTPTPDTTTLRIEAETYTDAAAGVYFGGTDDEGGGEAVYDFDLGRWIAFANVDLEGGVVTFRYRGDSAGSGDISLRIGSATEAPFCTLAWTPGGTYYTTRETTCSTPVSGIVTLYVTNDSVAWVNTNWIEVELLP